MVNANSVSDEMRNGQARQLHLGLNGAKKKQMIMKLKSSDDRSIYGRLKIYVFG
jgi:hypothetical protein